MSNEKQLRQAYQWALEQSPLLESMALKFLDTKFFEHDPALERMTLRAKFRAHENGDMAVMFSPGGRNLKVIGDHNSKLLVTLDFKLPKEFWSGHKE